MEENIAGDGGGSDDGSEARSGESEDEDEEGSGEEWEDEEEDEEEADTPEERQFAPQKPSNQENDNGPEDNMSVELKKKREDDRRKGMAVSRQIVSTRCSVDTCHPFICVGDLGRPP